MEAISDPAATIPPARRIYANRTLNLRSIAAIGYDMDYTLVHYRVEEWEREAYGRLKEILAEDGWPVDGLEFDHSFSIRGLVIDSELGNIVKANRFGYVVRAFHGTRPMSFEGQRAVYQHTPIDLAEPRYFFLNTLFSLSEACLFGQLVDLFDRKLLPAVQGYLDLFRRVRATLNEAHLEGTLKAQIMAEPARFVEPDPEAPLALLDQLKAGKRLMLITNSDWPYARAIMSWAFDPFLAPARTWRDLFELVIVSARKPHFFSSDLQVFAVEEETGLLHTLKGAIPGPGCFLGGDASKVERYLGVSGAEILFVGDHVFEDVRMSKSTLRWRTALILRELEQEIAALESLRPQEARLAEIMARKQELEHEHCRLRLALQRLSSGYGLQDPRGEDELHAALAQLRPRLEELDTAAAPLAKLASEAMNPLWGPLLRAGYDRSDLARQVERSADVYTSRVSNFLYTSPFAYLRAVRGSMPHDPIGTS